MKKKFLGFISASLLFFALAACSEKEETKAPTEEPKTEDVTKEETKDEAVTPTGNIVEVKVKMTNFEFDVKEIKAKPGDTVRLTVENDIGAHGLAIDEFDVDVKSGESVEFIVDKAGEFEYYCSQLCGTGHDIMAGKLIVQ